MNVKIVLVGDSLDTGLICSVLGLFGHELNMGIHFGKPAIEVEWPKHATSDETLRTCVETLYDRATLLRGATKVEEVVLSLSVDGGAMDSVEVKVPILARLALADIGLEFNPCEKARL